MGEGILNASRNFYVVAKMFGLVMGILSIEITVNKSARNIDEGSRMVSNNVSVFVQLHASIMVLYTCFG